MNIAIFTNNYLPNPYGVTGSIESFRKQFEKRGHTVYIFAPRFKEYKDANPNVFRYPSLDISYKFRFPLAIPISKRMDRMLRKLDVDIIHSQHPNLLGWQARRWARKKHIPLIFTWHTLYDQYAHFFPLIPQKITGKHMIRGAVRYANKSDYVITPTNSVKEIIKKWGVTNKHIEAIPTGIEEEFYQNADRKLIRQKYALKDTETLLLLVSRLTQEKNIAFLFNAIIKVLKNNPGSKFLIAGDGYLLPELQAIAAKNNLGDRIIFEGIVAKEKLKQYYAAADAFVYASKSETQGMIVSEAMYMGLPIVAVDAPGICDLVQNTINGFLVAENEEVFSSAVEKLINDIDLRHTFSKESERIAHKNFTDKVCAEKMLTVYESLIKEK